MPMWAARRRVVAQPAGSRSRCAAPERVRQAAPILALMRPRWQAPPSVSRAQSLWAVQRRPSSLVRSEAGVDRREQPTPCISPPVRQAKEAIPMLARRAWRILPAAAPASRSFHWPEPQAPPQPVPLAPLSCANVRWLNQTADTVAEQRSAAGPGEQREATPPWTTRHSLAWLPAARRRDIPVLLANSRVRTLDRSSTAYINCRRKAPPDLSGTYPI